MTDLIDSVAALIDENAALRAEVERLRAELTVAKKCIGDIETYLDLGSARYAYGVIVEYRNRADGVGKEVQHD